MRQGNNGRRPRGGRPNRRPGPLKSQTFDSNGPDVRIRGNANQVYEKYLNLARDCTAGGDRVLAESYWQFAEHYYRIIHESTDPDSPGSHRPHLRDPRYDDRDGQWDDEDQGGQSGGPQGGQQRDYQGRGGDGYRSESQGRDNQGRDNRDYQGRDNQSRDRDSRRENQGRDNQGRDNQARDNQGRDNQARDSQPRDNQARDGQNRDAQPRDSQSQRWRRAR